MTIIFYVTTMVYWLSPFDIFFFSFEIIFKHGFDWVVLTFSFATKCLIASFASKFFFHQNTQNAFADCRNVTRKKENIESPTKQQGCILRTRKKKRNLRFWVVCVDRASIANISYRYQYIYNIIILDIRDNSIFFFNDENSMCKKCT